MRKDGPAQPAPAAKAPEPYPAEKARGALIALRKPWQRYVFFGGLVGIVVVLLLTALAVG